MQRAVSAVVCLSAILVMGACAAPAPAPAPPAGPSPAELVSAADALDKQFLEAFNKGDAEAVSALYWNSPDVVSIGPDGMGTKGWDAARTGAIEMFKAMPGAKLEFLSGSNAAHGDVVLGWGTWKMTIPGPTPIVMEGRYTDAKAMRDGKWVYLMDHASVPLPPPPAAGAAK